MTTPAVFRTEISRLYAAGHEQEFMAEDLAGFAKVDRHTMVKWLGGYACPATSAERTAVLLAIAKGLGM